MQSKVQCGGHVKKQTSDPDSYPPRLRSTSRCTHLTTPESPHGFYTRLQMMRQILDGCRPLKGSPHGFYTSLQVMR